MLRTFHRAVGAAILSLLLGASAHAADLTIGLSTPVTSLDPHFHNLTPNNSLGRHVFETLVRQDESQRMQPGLAESWKAINDLEWEIKLRKGVKFHNGQNFTADDVIATFKRVPERAEQPGLVRLLRAADRRDQGCRSADAAAEDRQAAPAAAERHGRRDDPAEVGGRDGEDRGLQLRQGDDRHRTVPPGRVRRRATAWC